ncbi:MAG: hypothetical protein AAGA90_02760 [Actinomycetota bacterium]
MADARGLLHELLYAGMTDIRSATTAPGALSAGEAEFVFGIAYVLHNLPHRLAAAKSDQDYEEVLALYQSGLAGGSAAGSGDN